MTQPVSAVWSSLSWTFAQNSSAGHARQFGPQWRASKLVCGIFNNLESRPPSVVYRQDKVGLWIKPLESHLQLALLPFRCLHDQPQWLWGREGTEFIHFGFLFTRMGS